MARLATCKSCNKKLQQEERYSHSSKIYCLECYQKIVRDSEEYKKLIEFICINYELEKPTGFILKQIKDMKTENSWSYAAMTYTLWYCKNVLGKQLLEKYGVALIKHYYDDAKDYYSQQEKMKDKMKKLDNVEILTKVVKQKQIASHGNSSLINIGNLLGGGDIQ